MAACAAILKISPHISSKRLLGGLVGDVLGQGAGIGGPGSSPVLYCCCVLRRFPEVHISSNQGHHLFKHSSALSLVTPPQSLQPLPKTTRRHTKRLLRMPSVPFHPIKTRRRTPPHGPETSGLFWTLAEPRPIAFWQGQRP